MTFLCRTRFHRHFTTSPCQSHENPLNLPRRSLPPSIPRFSRGLPPKRPIPLVRKVIAISSAKGGVGKSTIAANTTIALTRLGLRTGILDADIFGPSIPTILNLIGHEPHLRPETNHLIPLTSHGVKAMSMGFLLSSEQAPVVWRGLMVMKALQQLLHEVDWSPGLDVLVLDLPPGTGDTQLTIAQQVVLDGAVVVSTPQDVALKDAIKGIGMFEKVGVPVLGMVQNMSVFTCAHCGEDTHVFRQTGRLEAECTRRNLDVLAYLPLDPAICEDADCGRPTVAIHPEGKNGQLFMELARRIATKIGLADLIKMP